MEMDEKTKNYIRSQSMAAGPVLLKDLVCVDCAHRDEDMPVAFCHIFERGVRRKPNKVLLGGDCPVYNKERV